MASNVPPAPATEKAIVDCVAFFYEEGSYQMLMFDYRFSIEVSRAIAFCDCKIAILKRTCVQILQS